MDNKVISISQYKNSKKKKIAITAPSYDSILSEQYTDELANEFNELLKSNKKNKRGEKP